MATRVLLAFALASILAGCSDQAGRSVPPAATPGPKATLPAGWTFFASAHDAFSIGLAPGWSVDAASCDEDPEVIGCSLKRSDSGNAEIWEEPFRDYSDFKIEDMDDWLDAYLTVWGEQGVPAETSGEKIALRAGPAILATVKLSDGTDKLLIVDYVFPAGERRVVQLQFFGVDLDEAPAAWRQMAETFNPRGVGLP